jgi:predicted nucleic acid-binding Zn ribbon protein
MATRTYECTNEQCERKEFELDKSINDKDSDVVCPTCGSPVIRKFGSIPWKFNCEGAYGKTSK